MEKLIIQMITTGTTIGEKEELFEEYVKSGSNTKVELAYLSYCAYDYFVKDRMLDARVFEHLAKNYRRGEELNDACKLALLKHYTEEKKSIDQRTADMIREFLNEFSGRSIYFAFFKDYIGVLNGLSDFKDKVIIEYKTAPTTRVMLHYIIENGESGDNYHTEEMRNMYGGIFAKDFILFFGENLQYYISEEAGGEEYLTFSDSVSVSDNVVEGGGSRYAMINDMVVAKTLQDDDTLMQLMEEYVREECFAKRAFTCL